MNIYYLSGLSGKNLEISDQDTTSTSYLYYGFVAIDGSWIIMREDLTASPILAYRYATAKNNAAYSSYTSGWSARTSLNYGYFFNVQI